MFFRVNDRFEKLIFIDVSREFDKNQVNTHLCKLRLRKIFCSAGCIDSCFLFCGFPSTWYMPKFDVDGQIACRRIMRGELVVIS